MEHFRENPAFIEQLLARVESLETQVQTLQKQLRRVLEIEVETDTARLSCDSLTVRRGDSDAFLHAVADEDELYFGLVDGRDNNLELRLPLGEAAESSPSIHLYSAQNLVARMGVGEMGGEFVTLTRDQQPRTVAKRKPAFSRFWTTKACRAPSCATPKTAAFWKCFRASTFTAAAFRRCPMAPR